MRIQHSGDLSVEYFLSFLELLMKSRDFTVHEAREFMFHRFFKGDENALGEHTYRNFSEAFERVS